MGFCPWMLGYVHNSYTKFLAGTPLEVLRGTWGGRVDFDNPIFFYFISKKKKRERKKILRGRWGESTNEYF